MDEAKKVVGLAGEILEVAKQHPKARAAGDAAAESLNIVAQVVRNVLLPFAAVNFAVKKFETYCRERFGPEIEEALGDTPPEEIQAPRPTIAGPAIEALAWAHEEDELRRLYVQLLASAMRTKTAADAHPAFVQILRQIDASEIRHLETVLRGPKHIAIIAIRLDAEAGSGYTERHRNVLDFRDADGRQLRDDNLPAMIDNWVRLGLVTVSYSEYLTADGAYDWAEDRPELVTLRQQFAARAKFAKGSLSQTSLGLKFAAAVGMSGPQPGTGRVAHGGA